MIHDSRESRNEILRRIRRSLGEDTPLYQDDYASIARNYIQTGALDRNSRIQLFEERLKDYGATVYRCPEASLSETIGKAIGVRNVRRLLVPEGLPKEWLPLQLIECVPDRALDYVELDRIGGVLTASAVAIAKTGTILLQHSSSEGRRALTLIPDYHLCIVNADTVVETVPEAIRKISILDISLITTISGPSATSDIEMTRIQGVHGPRTLDVILVEAKTAVQNGPMGSL